MTRFLQEDNFLSRLERATAVTTHPGYSVTSTFVKKLRILAEFVARSFVTLPIRRAALSKLKELAATMSTQNALVLGNGPSVSTLDLEWLRGNRQKIDIFVVNWFPLSPIAAEIVPDCVVLSDPHHFPGNSQDQRNTDLWVKLAEMKPKIFLPLSWYSRIQSEPLLTELLKEKIYFFNDFGLEGWTKNISPLRPRGYLSLTAYKALAISVFLGYKQIFILGIDNTMYQTVEVDKDNQIFLDGNHFYEDQPKNSSGTFYPSGMADLFFDYSLCFLDLHLCFGSQRNIINLDPNSKVDAFNKRSVSEISRLT